MDHLPIFTKMTGKHCLLVGGGSVAARKLETLLDAGAQVTLVALDISDAITAQQRSAITILQENYSASMLGGKDLVIAATDDRQLNATISQDASTHHLFVNVVDNPELCSFIMPSIIDRSPITIAISTSGKAPVLARLLRGKIESFLPFSYGKLAQLADKYREQVKAALPTGVARKNFWERVFEGSIAEHVFTGNDNAADQELQALLQQAQDEPTDKGEVYLVGSGPGDPDLLSFRALRLMQKADVVVYDRLVSKGILNLVRRDAEKFYVGKKASDHCVPQDQINELLVKLAKAGKRVLRLKGGDPYIFGRGGEEAEELVKEGIQFQAVPGITSAAGASNYCGIPLTHRDYAQSVTFATGHLKDNTVDLDWPALARANQTLVIYMGLGGLEVISQQLIGHGLEADTPVAVIYKATQPDQRILISDLSHVRQRVLEEAFKTPSILIIGHVVKLYERLKQPS
ncbi:MAG: uroporphyrinogen-III C-methyltransferase [Pseudomonadales bacterium]|nr:uroporphyrinogen-III C-methyltransferase [Pseudomonadales bacterium]MCP5215680.1 uroporphyrinogen-III C-methyltransferase [Pseudomonadales bacterium]